jgi:hypothetical protein
MIKTTYHKRDETLWGLFEGLWGGLMMIPSCLHGKNFMRKHPLRVTPYLQLRSYFFPLSYSLGPPWSPKGFSSKLRSLGKHLYHKYNTLICSNLIQGIFRLCSNLIHRNFDFVVTQIKFVVTYKQYSVVTWSRIVVTWDGIVRYFGTPCQSHESQIYYCSGQYFELLQSLNTKSLSYYKIQISCVLGYYKNNLGYYKPLIFCIKLLQSSKIACIKLLQINVLYILIRIPDILCENYEDTSPRGPSNKDPPMMTLQGGRYLRRPGMGSWGS